MNKVYLKLVGLELMKTVSVILLLILLPIVPISYAQSTSDISNDGPEWKIYHAPDKFGSIKPDNTFNIHYRITDGIIDTFEQIDQTFFKVKLVSKNNGIFEIKIPRNYPYSNLPDSPDEYNHTENRIMILSNGSEVSSGYGMNVTDCFYIHSIEFSGNKTFELGYPQLPVGLPFRGEKVPKHCIEETMVQNTSKNLVTLTPLKQFNNGITPQDVTCRGNLELLIKFNDGHPICVKQTTKLKLIERKIAFIYEPRGGPLGHNEIKVMGDDAKLICDILKISCPNNPSFSGVNLNEQIFVSYPLKGKIYDIVLNKTHVCMTNPESKQTNCDIR